MSLPPVVSFALITPSKHFRLGSKTPDPELPVVATSPIKVEYLLCNGAGTICGEIM